MRVRFVARKLEDHLADQRRSEQQQDHAHHTGTNKPTNSKKRPVVGCAASEFAS